MAINMLSEKDYITCPNCNGMVFNVKDAFTLKKVNTNSGLKISKKHMREEWTCSKCNTDISDQIKGKDFIK